MLTKKQKRLLERVSKNQQQPELSESDILRRARESNHRRNRSENELSNAKSNGIVLTPDTPRPTTWTGFLSGLLF